MDHRPQLCSQPSCSFLSEETTTTLTVLKLKDWLFQIRLLDYPHKPKTHLEMDTGLEQFRLLPPIFQVEYKPHIVFSKTYLSPTSRPVKQSLFNQYQMDMLVEPFSILEDSQFNQLLLTVPLMSTQILRCGMLCMLTDPLQLV